MKYKIKEGIVFRNVGGIYFLVDIHKKNYYTDNRLTQLNEMGNFIWTNILTDTFKDNSEIIENLIKNIKDYKEDMHDMISSDINAFLSGLTQKGCLDVHIDYINRG